MSGKGGREDKKKEEAVASVLSLLGGAPFVTVPKKQLKYELK